MMLNRTIAILFAVGVLASIPWVWSIGAHSGASASLVVEAASTSSSVSITTQQAGSDRFETTGVNNTSNGLQSFEQRLHELREQAGEGVDATVARLPSQVLQELGITRADLEQRREAYELARPDTDPDQLPDLDQLRPTLEPRRPVSKRPTEELAAMPNDATGTLIVKFRDDVRMRIDEPDRLASRTGVNVQAVSRLIRRLGLDMEPAFLRSEQQLRLIETRAAVYSGKDQPDLAGMIHLSGPERELTRAAQMLNEMDLVEFVEFEREMQTGDVGVILPDVGACCTPDTFFDCTGCIRTTPEFCFLMNGTFQGAGSSCTDNTCGVSGACCLDFTDITGDWLCAGDVEGHATCEQIGLVNGGVNAYFQGNTTECLLPNDELICEDDFSVECGECTGPCFSPHLSPYCELEFVCDAVCSDIDPFCCGEAGPGEVTPGRGPQRWDAICAMHAAPFGVPFDPPIHPSCIAAFGPCFEVHPGTGCSAASCCGIVCAINPNCCVQEWNAECVQLANSVCAVGTALGEDLTPLQGYLTPTSYIQDLGGIPNVYRDPPFSPLIPAVEENPFDPTDDTVIAAPGFGGEGYNLAQFDALAELLFEDFGIGHNPEMPGAPTSKGETIRVGVIEHSAHVQPVDPEENNHLALQHVISEPGQTILNIPGSSNLTGDHGTAVLGIIGGRDRITGIAPETENYFFPIVSAEEGGRLGRAITSAMAEFGPGDVMNFSIGPAAGCGTLVSSQRNWMLIRMASDLGIISTVSAGNSCCNLDDGPQFGDEDSDVIIVGAGHPGRGPGNQHCRLGFSNYCNDCDVPSQVHVGAWGSLVTTAGYGNLVFDTSQDNPLLSHYTHTFSGTSAAAPMVAAVAARTQSFAKQFYGIPLTPAQVRTLIAGNGWTMCATTAQQCEPPGHGTETACPGSWDYSEDPDHIGIPCGDPANPGAPIGLTGLFSMGESLISTEFFTCSPFHEDVHTIRGEHVIGNVFSICAIDGNFYIAESQPTNQSSSPSNVPPEWSSPLSDVLYNVSGHVADVLVVGKAPQATVLGMSVEVVAQAPAGVSTAIIFVQVYDWDLNHWAYVASSVSPAGVTVGMVASPALMFNPQRFVKSDDQTVLVRVWAFAFNTPTGPGSSQQNNFQFPVDYVNVTMETPGWDTDPVN